MKGVAQQADSSCNEVARVPCEKLGTEPTILQQRTVFLWTRPLVDGTENDRKNQAFQLEEEQIRDSSRLDTRREAVTRGKG